MSEEAEQLNPEIKMVDPKAVEAEMIAEAKKRADDPAEQAAMVFTMYKANFERALKKLKGKAHTRLINALVLAPLVDAPLLTDAEKEAYFFGDSMIQAKWVMQMEMYRSSAQEVIDGVQVETSYGEPENTGDTNA